MTVSPGDAAVRAALLKRMTEFRLRRALKLKQSVERGETLTDSDIAFLKRVFKDARDIQPLVDRSPEYQDLCVRMIHLYHQITGRALENEKNS